MRTDGRASGRRGSAEDERGWDGESLRGMRHEAGSLILKRAYKSGGGEGQASSLVVRYLVRLVLSTLGDDALRVLR